MSNERFLELTIEVLKGILNRTSQNDHNFSSGKVLEISEVLDEMILAYYRHKNKFPLDKLPCGNFANCEFERWVSEA